MRKNFSYILNFLLVIIASQIIPGKLYSQKYIDVSGYEKKGLLHPRGFGPFEIDTNTDIKYYRLFTDIGINPKKLIGEVTINGVVNNNPDSIFFNLSNVMNVDSVKYNGIKINFSHYYDKVVLKKYTGTIFSVVFYYHGLPLPSGFGSFVFETNEYNNPVVWSLSEPYGASDWFPCKNAQYDKADSADIWIKCASAFTGVSNGVLKEITYNGDSTRTYKWKNSYPITSYLLSVAVTNYSLYKNYFRYAQNDSMPVLHFIYPEDIDSLKPLLDKTIDMLRIFSLRFGMYPFINEKYGHAQTGMGGAMEHQTATSIGVFNEYIIAHELGHQWFGDKITCRDWHNIWLNEGFATYSECVYVEDTYGKNAYNNIINDKMFFAKKAAGSIYVQDITSVNNIFDGNRSYAKGGIVLHMLRGVVGDSAFFNILRSYAADTGLAYGTAVTEDFRKVAENISGIQLGYFFDEWIYGQNYPVYRINWNYEQIGNEIYSVAVTVNQKQNTNPAFFSMPVDIKIKTSYGDTTFYVFNNSLSQTFSFDVKGKPVLIIFDPENKILKDKNGDDPIEIVTYKLNQNYPNPFNPKTTISYEIAGNVHVKITIYDLLGRQCAVLINEKQKAGKYDLSFDGKRFASGVYIYKINAGDYQDARRMVLVK